MLINVYAFSSLDLSIISLIQQVQLFNLQKESLKFPTYATYGAMGIIPV
jgi:hypothetical protein